MRSEQFVAFVRESHERLLRLADLLEEDPREAEELVRAALADTRRRRGTGALEPARERLVRRHVGHRSRRAAASGFVHDGRRNDVEPDGVRRVLADLPARARAAVVLSLYEDVPVEQVARLLRASVDTVRGDVARGTAQLAHALAGGPTATGPAPGATGADVGSALDLLVRDVARPPLDAVTVAGEVSSAFTAGRRRRALAGTTLVAAVAVAAAVVVLPVDEPARVPASRDVAVEVPPSNVPVHFAPTRGSLADDAAFLDGLLELPWLLNVPGESGGTVEETPAARRVVFAGDVPGGRWALLVGAMTAGDPAAGDRIGGLRDSERLVMAWFTGPEGAAPQQMTLGSYPYGVSPEFPASLLDPETGTLVVVAAPGDVTEVSERPVVAADGAVSRSFDAVPTVEGVAVTRLDVGGAPYVRSVRYRVVRSGGPVIDSTPDVIIPSLDTGQAPIDIGWPRGRPDPAAAADAAQSAAQFIHATLGLPPGDTETVADWAGPAPDPDDGSIAVVTVYLPSGAEIVTVQWAGYGNSSGATGGRCGLKIRPADARSDRRLLAAGCDLYGSSGAMSSPVLVALAPPGVVSVRMYGSNGSFLGEEPVADGVAVALLRRGVAKVEGVTADGVLLGRTGLIGHDNIWD